MAMKIRRRLSAMRTWRAHRRQARRYHRKVKRWADSPEGREEINRKADYYRRGWLEHEVVYPRERQEKTNG